MKKVFLILVMFLFGGLSVFAYQYYGDLFEDDAKIPDWAKISVYKMKDAGIINGYSDKTFGPGHYVTRAELATMLDRYSEKIVNENIYQFVFALDRVGYLDLKGGDEDNDKGIQAALILAEAGFFMMAEAPEGYNNGKPNPDEFVDITNADMTNIELPKGYSLYHEIPYEFYLRYKGDRNVGQDSIPVDEWFGPFSFYDGAYLR